jgi:ribosomal protein S12 methylthiotransferase
LEKNQEKIGRLTDVFLIEKKEIISGKKEYDSPDVDNTVLVEAKDTYISIGELLILKLLRRRVRFIW